MRLVRQRDELKEVVKLAEQRDSYFILGLDGPDATEEQVKKAYRNLARKEHPDKAGIGNKRRFQAIQQAYTSIMRQMREGGQEVHRDTSATPVAAKSEAAAGSSIGVIVAQAAEAARQACEAADR